ncbi:MAG: 50S ribosomal protein L6 [Candidatus Aenigmarchaeota archaeon]|nr:50S ribosomal protein L6 [Candidatus Aenigmarchaeota archaeon]
MQKKVEIPDGVTVGVEQGNLVVKGPKGEMRKSPKGVKVDIKDKEVILSSGSERRKEKAMVGTWSAHLRNMIIGVTQGWEARLKTVYSHFPVKFNIEDEKVIIQNFMGERKPRTAKIVGDAKVDVKKDEVVITGIDKDDVGQTAANIELTTKVKGYDRRVFQDGCHLIQKCKPIEESTEGEKNE